MLIATLFRIYGRIKGSDDAAPYISNKTITYTFSILFNKSIPSSPKKEEREKKKKSNTQLMLERARK